MAYRTLAFSLFIIFIMGSFTLVNSFMVDVEKIDNRSVILKQYSLGENGSDMRVDSVGALNGSFDSIRALEMWDQPANEQEQSGGEFSSTSMARIVWDVLINSSVGFASFVRILLSINEGTFASSILSLIQWGILLNHSFAIMQIIFSKLGSGGV